MGCKVDVHISVLKAHNHDLAGTTDVFEAAMKKEKADQRELVTSELYDNTTAIFDRNFAPMSSHDLVMLTLLREAPLYRNLRRCSERAVSAAIAAGATAALRRCCREDFHLSVKPTWMLGDGFWLMDA